MRIVLFIVVVGALGMILCTIAAVRGWRFPGKW